MQEKNIPEQTPQNKNKNLLDTFPDNPKSHKLMSRQDDPDALFVENEFELKTELDKDNTALDSVRLPDFVNDPVVEPLEVNLTKDDKQNVLSTWNMLRENYGIKAIGKIFLKQFFKNSVDYFQSFLEQEQMSESKTIEQVQKSKAFGLIAIKCSKTISKIVELVCTDECENIVSELKRMGQIYMQWYKVLPDHYHTAQLSLLAVMNMGLQEKFNAEVRESWNSFLKFSKQALISNNYLKEEVTNDDCQPDDEALITIVQVNHVQETWAQCEKLQLQNVGLIVFKQFLAISPECKQLFPFGDYADQDSINDEFYQSPKVQKHCLKVAETVGWAVQNLDNEALFISTIQELGKRHVKYGMKLEHIPAIGQALLNTVSMALKDKFTEEVSLAWEKFIQLLADNMISDNFPHPTNVIRKQTTLFLQKSNTKDVELANIQLQKNSQADQKLIKNKTMILKTSGEEQSQSIKENLEKQNQIITQQTMKLPDPLALNQQVQNPLEQRLSRTNKQTIIQKKLHKMDSKVQNEILACQKQKYASHFQKEVDFHHNIAFKFERAYRLAKKLESQAVQSDLESSMENEQNAVQLALLKNIKMINQEIIDCLSDHSGYIEHDPMTIFYCLFFCIYYRNTELIPFFKMMVQQVDPDPHARNKLDKTIEYIDINGIDCLRDTSEKINSIVYHNVFYQAIDDDLRIVYQMIMRQVKSLQMRDKDALHLLRQRDYELIKHTFKLSTIKLKTDLSLQEKQTFRCNSYRKYNQAYYEEIIITNQGQIEQRACENYRERFLVSHEDIYVVFQMYCKEDYEREFLHTKKDDITHKEFVELFKICLRNDSHKIGILIYSLYLDHSADLDANMMNIVIQSCRSSTLLHEIKLFYIHSNFDVLSILQMDSLIDVYTEVCSTKTLKLNPMISQYNVIKIALLIYRICWRIEQKQIYSLITKCYDLQRYILDSLKAFIEKQSNILMVQKFLSEPILDLSKKYDCFDIMIEMNMQELLTHPVIVEVLNLVYEGKYSASQNALCLSSTYQFGSEVDAFSNKSIMERIVANIKSFGEQTTPKQTSLQFAIWKQSIQQRIQDETLFTVIINFAIISLSIAFNFYINANYHEFKQNFGGYIPLDPKLWSLVQQEKIKNACAYLQESNNFRNIYFIVQALNYAILFNMIGTIANLIQKSALVKLKDNVMISKNLIACELLSIVISVLILRMFFSEADPSIYSERCLESGFEFVPGEQLYVDKILALEQPGENQLNFRFLVSVSTIHAVLTVLTLLQKTVLLGPLLTMLDFMSSEFMRFCIAFGYIFLGFLIACRFLEKQISLSLEVQALWIQLRNLIELFIGMPRFAEYSSGGKAFVASFMLIFKVLLVSILGSIFINRYNTLFKNLENIRLNNIITLKNQMAYDKQIGGITISFFPINIIMIPFLPVVASLKNARVSEFVLKIQYMFLMILYLILGMAYMIPMLPYFYCKIIANSLFLATSNARKESGIQKVQAIIFTIICGPFALLLSVLVDLATLPDNLLKEHNIFERKYNFADAFLNETQVPKVMKMFDSLLGEQYELRFKNQAISLVELMTMHRRIFNITANMHELLCRGTKDYRSSLTTVHDFNMSKLLAFKCSIPSPDGIMKNSLVEFDVLAAVYKDIQLYNFIDVTIRKLNMGKLRESVELAEEGKQSEDTVVNDNIDENEEDDELRKVEGILPIEIGPDNMPLKRNKSDVMGNFFINNAAKSFTNIEKLLSKITNADEKRKQQRVLKEIEDQKQGWMNSLIGNYTQSLNFLRVFEKNNRP